MRPDRAAFFRAMRVIYGIRGDRLRALKTDLEPLFRMAEASAWPEGTDCGFAGKGPRKPTDRTPPMPEIAAEAKNRRVLDSGGMAYGGIEALAERFHEQVCSILGDGRVVEIGAVMGTCLLDALFSRLGGQKIDAYMFFQYIALYRTAAAAAGLDTEVFILRAYLRGHLEDEEACEDVDLADVLEEIPIARAAG